jgi:hypothetical protein
VCGMAAQILTPTQASGACAFRCLTDQLARNEKDCSYTPALLRSAAFQALKEKV